ncbi:hypothetical protein G9A89_021002 [Geosiphon pyriformis]|nr:hypothetical protein G9A89_021002 [Geosiphon pyriformis]
MIVGIPKESSFSCNIINGFSLMVNLSSNKHENLFWRIFKCDNDNDNYDYDYDDDDDNDDDYNILPFSKYIISDLLYRRVMKKFTL